MLHLAQIDVYVLSFGSTDADGLRRCSCGSGRSCARAVASIIPGKARAATDRREGMSSGVARSEGTPKVKAPKSGCVGPGWRRSCPHHDPCLFRCPFRRRRRCCHDNLTWGSCTQVGREYRRVSPGCRLGQGPGGGPCRQHGPGLGGPCRYHGHGPGGPCCYHGHGPCDPCWHRGRVVRFRLGRLSPGP